MPDVTRWLAHGAAGRDLDAKAQIPGWAAGVAASVVRSRTSLRRALGSDGRPPFILVHGDTFTTVLGALAGHVLGVQIGHVEAGMRSGDLRNPFPEELNRRIAARLVHVHYAPGDRPVSNLRREGVRGVIVDTRQNTIRDAIELKPPAFGPSTPVPEEPFGLVSIHRFELIEREEELAALLSVLHEHSRRQQLLFVDHSTTAAVIDRAPSLRELFDERFRRIPRQPYLQFITLLRRCAFLVSDSGGSQEESAFLGLPCLIHRTVSEHDTGLDGSVVLSRLDLGVVRSFLADPARHRTAPAAEGSGPSARIADDLETRGLI